MGGGCRAEGAEGTQPGEVFGLRQAWTLLERRFTVCELSIDGLLSAFP